MSGAAGGRASSADAPGGGRTSGARRRALALGRLLRISLLPTAAADVLAGLLLAGRGELPGAGPTLALVGASLLVYHGSLALNDWADRAHDARTRPDRPLPSGAIPARLVPPAVALAYGAAVGLAALVAPRAALWVAVLALVAAFYDLFGRGPRLGPALLAVCRGMNLGLGLWIALPEGVQPLAWSLPLLYGAYVWLVSRLGRLEDGEDAALSGGRPARFLRGAACLLVLPALVPLEGVDLLERGVALALLLAGAAGLWARAGLPEWTPAAVGASMGLALRRLLLFTAAVSLLHGTPAAWVTAALLLGLGYPLSRALSRPFPPS